MFQKQHWGYVSQSPCSKSKSNNPLQTPAVQMMHQCGPMLLLSVPSSTKLASAPEKLMERSQNHGDWADLNAVSERGAASAVSHPGKPSWSTNIAEYSRGHVSLDMLLGRTHYQVSRLSQRFFSWTLTSLKISDQTMAPKFNRKLLDPGKIRTYLNYTAKIFQFVRQG